MPCWPVSHQDGNYQVTDNDGILYPITMGRMPLRTLNPGWYPVGLQTSLRPFHLLELRNDAAPEPDAVWYLDDELDFVANTPLHFTPEQTDRLVSNLSPLLRDIHDQTLCAAEPAVAESSHDFDGVNPRFVRELIGCVVETGLSPPDVVAAQRLDGVSAHYSANGVRLSASLLRHSLDVTAPAPEHGAFSVASPFDATLLFAQEELVPEPALEHGGLIQAYRFRDPVGQLTFYMLFQRSGAPALYIPAMNTVFATQDDLSGAGVMTTLLSHYASHTDRAVHAAQLLAPPAEAPGVGAPGVGTAVTADADASADAVRDQREPEPVAMPLPANWWKRLFGLGT